MTVRSVVLAKARPSAAGTFVTVYTCPAGKTAILKDVRSMFLQSTAGSAFLSLSSGGLDYNLGAWSGAFPVAIQEELWVVLEPGDLIQVWSQLANGSSWWISGAELDGVAP